MHVTCDDMDRKTYVTSEASLAGPISDRVVKPVALQNSNHITVAGVNQLSFNA